VPANEPDAFRGVSQGVVRLFALAALLLQSGRQDLNLRPPGPQPEGWGVAQLMRPVFVGFSAPQRVPVALNLFPRLFPEHVFVTDISAEATPRREPER